MNIEIWKDIFGYEGFYQVSNLGQVRSLDRIIGIHKIVKKSKFLKAAPNPDGYLCVVLCKEGVNKTKKVHRLVAIHFIENKFNKSDVNHIDGNKFNNKVSNLEWNTETENINHAFKMGLIKPKIGKDHHNSKPLFQLDESGKIINNFESCCQAAKFLNIHQALINRVCNNKLLHTHGLYFRWQ